jgi:hypothetical protein
VLNRSGDLGKSQFLVVNKEVNLLNSLFGGQKGFSETEIAELEKIHGVRDAAGLTASRFKVSVSMGADGMPGIPGMQTDLFFEAVPDNFIDVDAAEWQWREGDSLVPIVIPRDYLKLYNFGFASTQGLPQVTEGLVGLARFNIKINGPKGSAVFRGKLSGFSERINSILAPASFIDYANEKFAGEKPGDKAPSRVIIECEGAASSELIEYLSENDYETSADALRNSKYQSYLRVITTVVVIIGSVIIILALLCFLLYSQLLMSRSSYELETLIRIGYSYRRLGLRYIRYYALIYSGIFVFTIIVLWLMKAWFRSFMSKMTFELPPGLSATVLLYGLLFTSLFLAANYLVIMRNLRKLA